MTEQELRENVLDALTGIAPDIDAADVNPEVSFHDQFEIDSVDFMSFVLALEERLDIKTPEVDYPKLSTLNGCLEYLSDPAKP